MIFDPFGDFETHGYLRNKAGEKDIAIVTALEEVSVQTGIEAAVYFLHRRFIVKYEDILEVHRILFEAVYPWAGTDRTHTAPNKTVSRGSALFANPTEIRRAVDHALRLGNDPDKMKKRPGEIMGLLAYGHPFLEGNGRTIMLVHTVLAQRAGISINWVATNKVDYLRALTAEVDDPRAGALDKYLANFISEAVGEDQMVSHVHSVKGLHSRPQEKDELLDGSDPGIRARYQAQALRYEEVFSSEETSDLKK